MGQEEELGQCIFAAKKDIPRVTIQNNPTLSPDWRSLRMRMIRCPYPQSRSLSSRSSHPVDQKGRSRSSRLIDGRLPHANPRFYSTSTTRATRATRFIFVAYANSY